jgi:hypothetical protein
LATCLLVYVRTCSVDCIPECNCGYCCYNKTSALSANCSISFVIFCPSQIGMLKCVITLYEESQRAIADSPADKRISWSYIKTTLANLIQKVVDCKFVVSLLSHVCRS